MDHCHRLRPFILLLVHLPHLLGDLVGPQVQHQVGLHTKFFKVFRIFFRGAELIFDLKSQVWSHGGSLSLSLSDIFFETPCRKSPKSYFRFKKTVGRVTSSISLSVPCQLSNSTKIFICFVSNKPQTSLIPYSYFNS